MKRTLTDAGGNPGWKLTLPEGWIAQPVMIDHSFFSTSVPDGWTPLWPCQQGGLPGVLMIRRDEQEQHFYGIAEGGKLVVKLATADTEEKIVAAVTQNFMSNQNARTLAARIAKVPEHLREAAVASLEPFKPNRSYLTSRELILAVRSFLALNGDENLRAMRLGQIMMKIKGAVSASPQEKRELIGTLKTEFPPTWVDEAVTKIRDARTAALKEKSYAETGIVFDFS